MNLNHRIRETMLLVLQHPVDAAPDAVGFLACHHAGIEIDADLDLRMGAGDCRDEGRLVGLHVAGQVVGACGEQVVEDEVGVAAHDAGHRMAHTVGGDLQDPAQGWQFHRAEHPGREDGRRGGGLEKRHVQAGGRDRTTQRGLVFGQAPQKPCRLLRAQEDLFAQVADAAQIEGDGEGASHRDPHIGGGEFAFQALAHLEDHRDAASGLRVEGFERQAFFERV